MSKTLFKLSKSWPGLLTSLVILVFIFWPFFSLTETDSWSSSVIFKDSTFKTNKLPSESPLVITKKPSENVLVFGGDIMLSRSVNGKMEQYQDYTWPLFKISPLFNEADLAIANLESPFLIKSNYQMKTDSFLFKANPLSVAALSLAGLDVLSLANNHILNAGEAGLRDTRKILDEAIISYVGLASSNIIIKERKGIKFAFLAFTYAPNSKAIASMLDISQAKTDIKKAKNQAAVVIVLMHAGTEYQRTPNQQQINFAHAAISAGADLVIGHHPHWVQTVENYQGKTIIYSLGNLVFDQMWSKETSVGLVARIYFTDQALTRIEYIPINIKDYGQAEVMPMGADYNKLLESIRINK